MMLPFIRICVSRAPGDCTICALSTYLGMPYEDVLAAAVKMNGDPRVHHAGMWVREMKKTAKRLGYKLKLKRSVDFESDEGVLSTENDDQTQHSLVLWSGVIYDCDGTAWEPEAYLASKGQRTLSLLVCDEKERVDAKPRRSKKIQASHARKVNVHHRQKGR